MHFFGIEKFGPKILQISLFKNLWKNYIDMVKKKEERIQTYFSLSFIPIFVIILLFYEKQELVCLFFFSTAAFLI